MKMEGGSSSVATGGDGNSVQAWNLWLPRRRDYTSSSSTSGTTLSTTYTSVSSHLQSSDVVGEGGRDLDTVKDLCHVQDLVFQFCGGDDSVLERWLSELDVGWVLHLAGDAYEERLRPLQHFTMRWIRALTESTASIARALSEYVTSTGEKGKRFEDTPLLSARFAQATLLKMLPFVSTIRSADTAAVSDDGWAVALSEKLQALIDVRDALSKATEAIALVWGYSSTIQEVESYTVDKFVKIVDEAIWDTIAEIRGAGTLSSTDEDSGATHTPQGSSDVHKVTRSVIKCINMLLANFESAYETVWNASKLGKYVPRYVNVGPLISLILEIVSFLEQMLAKRSRSFPDQSLRFLFLLNNTYFIREQLHADSHLASLVSVLSRKIDDYVQRYLQVSWVSVLSCLHDRTPLCLGRYSPLAKFESEFHKTYTAQKLWRVPDPELRRRLRKAIVQKVSSGFTKFLEDNNSINPRVTPQELEKMLQQLFEG